LIYDNAENLRTSCGPYQELLIPRVDELTSREIATLVLQTMADHGADNSPHNLSTETSNLGHKPITSGDATRDMEMGSQQSSSPSLVPNKQEKDHTSPGSELKSVHHYHLLSTAWALEIFAIALSYAAFIAIIIVLRIYQNRPQEAWRKDP